VTVSIYFIENLLLRMVSTINIIKMNRISHSIIYHHWTISSSVWNMISETEWLKISRASLQLESRWSSIYSVSSNHLIHVSSSTIYYTWLWNSIWISCLNVWGVLLLFDWLLAVLGLSCSSCCLDHIAIRLSIINLLLVSH
jgi:hypothetical protein